MLKMLRTILSVRIFGAAEGPHHGVRSWPIGLPGFEAST